MSTTASCFPSLLASQASGDTYALLGDDLDNGGDPAGEWAVVNEDEAADLDGSPRRGLNGRGHSG